MIVLAAGRGERFAASGGGGRKLDALLAGRRVLEHVLDAVRASGLDHHLVLPDPSRPGMGDSIAAGVTVTAAATGWLILPGDLPLITPETLRAIALAPATPVTVPVYRGQRGHPVRFGAECADALMALRGEKGAASIVRACELAGTLSLVETDDAGVVTDVDTLEDLRRAEALLVAGFRPS